jgi:predicted  nucleic acid-binding Zn-ribbon protein
MNEDLLPLHQLFLMDDRLDRARKELAALDEPLPVAIQRDKIVTELGKYEAALKKATVALREAESDLKALEAKREEDKKKLYGGKIVATRELQALEREIEKLGQSISAGEDRVLEAMSKIEPLQASADKLAQYKKAAEAKLAGLLATQEEKRKRLRADIAQSEPMREIAHQKVEPALLRQYEQIRNRLKRPGLSVISGGACGICHTSVPSMVIRRLQESDDIIQCDTCNCIYFLPQESRS